MLNVLDGLIGTQEDRLPLKTRAQDAALGSFGNTERGMSHFQSFTHCLSNHNDMFGHGALRDEGGS